MSEMSYIDLYKKRLNRYGDDYQSRLEGKRAREFEDFLLKSANRVDFRLGEDLAAGVLERYKQDLSSTQGYLLTRKDCVMKSGTVISFEGEKEENFWMIWWLEQIKTSGYNRYVVLKLNYMVEWEGAGIRWTSPAHFSTPATRMIQDSATKGSDGARILENNNLHMFILPFDKQFKRDMYLETKQEELSQSFRVSELDNQATPGVSYLTVVPIAARDTAPAPEKTEGDRNEDFFWLEGGAN